MRSIGCIPAASSQGMSMERLSGRTAVVGIARTETPFTPGKTSLRLHGVHEVEINPLIVGDEGAGATAADALVMMERR